jgi:hypothetical protein
MESPAQVQAVFLVRLSQQATPQEVAAAVDAFFTESVFIWYRIFIFLAHRHKGWSTPEPFLQGKTMQDLQIPSCTAVS